MRNKLREVQSELAKLEKHLALFPHIWPEMEPNHAINQAKSWVAHEIYSAEEVIKFAEQIIKKRTAEAKRAAANQKSTKGLHYLRRTP